MPFLCPECTTRSLRITDRLELPADSRSDEISVQIVRCVHCRFAGLAIYEESRRGALGEESYQHTGYRIGPEQRKALEKEIRSCPEKRNPRCECPAHRGLGSRNNSGRWNALDDLLCCEAFGLEM